MKRIENYIGGHFHSSAREFQDVNPADGSLIATVCEADALLVDAAVHAARRSLLGEWGRIGVRNRAALLD